MVSRDVHGTTVECVKGDITDQGDVEAVVNAANAQLRTGGGVAGAIHGAAGRELTEATRKYAPIETGEAVITDAFNLPNEYVIHTLGPVHGRDKPEDELLASCYSESLRLADENGIESVAFPAISTGAFGYPMEEAAEVAVRIVLEEVEGRDLPELVRFVLWDDRAYTVHENQLESRTR